MLKRNFILTGIGAAAIVAVGGLAAFNLLLSGGAPAAEVTAVPLVVNTAVPAAVAAGATPTPAPTGASAPTETSPVVFVIVSDQSQARFSIYEELGGQPKTVVGVTHALAGELAVNAQDLSQTQVGVIQVSAGSFQTDSERRNGAIRNFILNSSQYPLITFTPTAISGLSGSAAPGQAFTFQVAGDLTIRDITRPVTFEVTATGASAAQITGTATALIRRSDYGLTIPSVPNVANVGDEITLELTFVAEARD